MDIIDLYAQNDYSNNAFHDKIFMFYLVGDEYVSRSSTTTSPDGVQRTSTVTSGWKYNLNKRGIYPICEEDYYIESVYNGEALLARSSEDASHRLNIGNYSLYSENDISATIDTYANTELLGGKFGNFRFYVNEKGVFIYKDKTLNGDFTPHTGLIPTPGMISCVGIKHWTPFREEDGSQSVFKSMIIQQGYNDYSLDASYDNSTTPSDPNSTVKTELNGTLDTHFNNIQYNWEHVDTIRIQRHPIHPEQVLRPVTLNSNMFKAEGWKIINIGGGNQFIQPSKKEPFSITNNQIVDKYFTSGICQLNKWGLPSSNHIIKGEWIQIQTSSQQISSYSFSSLQGYGTDSTSNGPQLFGANNGPLLDRSIKDWLLVGSTDGINWVLLDRQMNQNFNSNSFNKTFTINYPTHYVSSNPTSSQLLIPSYNYVRLVVSAVSINNLDLIWDVGNFYVTNFSGVHSYGQSISTSIVDKLVTNCASIGLDKYRWDESNIRNGTFNLGYIDNSPSKTLPTHLHSVIQNIFPTYSWMDIHAPNYNNIIQDPTIMNNTIKSYRTNPISSDMKNNYSSTPSGGNQNRMLQTLTNGFVSIHLNHYIYSWTETYSKTKLGNTTTPDANGNKYLNKPDYIGMPFFNMVDTPIQNGTLTTIEKRPTISGTSLTNKSCGIPYYPSRAVYKAAPDGALQYRWYKNLVTDAPSIEDLRYVFNTNSYYQTWNQVSNADWYAAQSMYLESHWTDIPLQVPMAIRVHGNKWDKSAAMFPNRSKYNYYKGTTATTFTNPFNITTSLLQTEKPGDTNVADPRFRWSLPFHTGSYLISPYGQVNINYDANGNQINSNSVDTNNDRIIPNYCFWIEDATTYQKLINAGVPISSNDNFNMKIKIATPADTNTYNDVPKRCLGALYTNTDGKSNISTSAISTLCPSPLQYKALGWKLCYLPSGCSLTYLGRNDLPNAIINKYNNIIFKMMDAYTAQLYYEADPNKDIITNPNINATIFNAPGGCSTCNCQSARTTQTNQTAGYCVRKASSNYYVQMKEINSQENIDVFNMQTHPFKQKILESQLKQDMDKSLSKKRNHSNKEHFDICKIAANLFAGGANFILDVTYNPLANLVSQLKPLRSMKSIHLTPPDWSCNIDIDEIVDAFISLFKSKEFKHPNPAELAYNEFCKLTSEFMSGPCYIGGILFNNMLDVFGNVVDACKNTLAIFAFGDCNGFATIPTSNALRMFTAFSIAGPIIVNVIVNFSKEVWDTLSSFGNVIISTLSSLVNNIFDAISNITDMITGILSSLITSIINGFTQTFTSIYDGIKDIVNTIGSTIISFFDWL